MTSEDCEEGKKDGAFATFLPISCIDPYLIIHGEGRKLGGLGEKQFSLIPNGNYCSRFMEINNWGQPQNSRRKW